MDARRRRTRDRLHAVVLELAAQQSPEDLSVTALAAAAGVHRSTLYEHAASPVALLEQALLAELDALRDHLMADTAGDVVRAVTETTEGVLHHVVRHAAIYRRGLGVDSGGASLHAILSEHFRSSSLLLQQLARVDVDVAVPGVADDVVADLATRFIAEGTVGVIAGWVQGPDPDVAAFMAVYVRLLPAWWPRDLTLDAPG